MANNSENHSKLVNEVLLEVAKRFKGDVVLWKQHTGQAITKASVLEAINFLIGLIFSFNPDKLSAADILQMVKAKLKPISYGLVGQCDLSGIRKSDGKRVEIEVKTGTGRLSKDQKNFRDMILRCNGIHIELRKLSDLDILGQSEMKV